MRPAALRRTLAVLAAAAMTTSLAACQSTESESAQIERESRAAVAAEQANERATVKRSHARHAGLLSGTASISHAGLLSGTGR
jgi:hypothetical protein